MSAPSRQPLPIDALRPEIVAAIDRGPLVITSPTGSGKSTQVPRWCPGRVLVVEPRRVACRSLAQRVAMLEGTALGEAVGYHVRDDRRAGEDTRLLYATPGIVLRIFDDALARFDTVIVDELHERSLEVDLLLALLLDRLRAGRDAGGFAGRLAVMSATLDGDRVAEHLAGRHLHAPGRGHPVDTEYRGGGGTGRRGPLLPDSRGLAERVAAAVADSRRHPGDVLVFLPGKGEIAACARALDGGGDEVIELHGGLSLGEQSRAFEPAERRKVVLATNVAETSVTLPGVGVVIDSGLVRQTRYHRDRGFLTLVPVAQDSADQRSGRAGRTAPGVCIRLWSEAAQLEPRTPPEVHRESLVPLLLAAGACGARVEELPFLDPPRTHAVAAARDYLVELGALDGDGAIRPRGRRLFGLPLPPHLGRLLVEAEERQGEGAAGLLDDAIDLAAALAPDRPLVRTPAGDRHSDRHGDRHGEPAAERPGDPLAEGCDAVRLIAIVRGGSAGGQDGGAKGAAVDQRVLEEAAAARRRLRQAFGLSGTGPAARRGVERKRLALTVLAADRTTAHVARRRGRRTAWSNGGTEVELGRESAAGPLAGEIEALAALDTRALGLGGRDTRLLITAAMPLALAWIEEAGLGRDRLAGMAVEDGVAVATLERVYARKVLASRRQVPRGALARRAVAELFLANRIFKGAAERCRERLEMHRLAHRLVAAGRLDGALLAGVGSGGGGIGETAGEPPPIEEWLPRRLEQLGLASGADLPLLAADDLVPPELPPPVRRELERRFPRHLSLPGAEYRVEYDLERGRVILHQVSGDKAAPPPRLTFLPSFDGFGIQVKFQETVRTLR